ncbi:MAG: TonB-dependent receptor [Proteobacteria bacterium]|nr:TonB-dependent receptor [Pseudomonadota bacterium]
MSATSSWSRVVLATLLVIAYEPVYAQEAVEEVVVQARLFSAAEALLSERMEDDAVSDVIGAEFISRVGDSTVAEALRRITGISLVGGKFVYVRGLGERYSSSTLNGATVPSPDLSRNVLPLDIFPTSIVSSLAVQKSYTVDRPASFGGGSVDIRTKGIPDGFTYSLELSGGFNTEVDGDLLSYDGGDDDWQGKDDGKRSLSRDIVSAINRFGGSLDPQSIRSTLRLEGNADASIADAQAINRQLATALNRDISITEESDDPDWGVKGSVGNNFLLNDEWEFGFLLAGGYSTQWRKTQTLARNFTFPDERFEREEESTRSVNLNGSLNLGVRYTDDHEISSTTLFIRNTDDEVAIIDFFNENRERSSGSGFRDERIKYEQRQMVVNQVKGSHQLGSATREVLPWLDFSFLPETLQYDWYYSEARAFTDIPNEVSVTSQTETDPVSAAVISTRVVTQSGAADYRFTDLDDEVTNHGGKISWPIDTQTSSIVLSGGWEYTEKVRTYRQSQFSLGALSVIDPDVLTGSLGTVFSSGNIQNPLNNFVFDVTGTNNQSYIAVTLTDAVFGNVDWTWNDTIRVSTGVRWEDYRQVALDWNIYSTDINQPQVSNDPDVLSNAVFTDDQYYPSISVTYMTEWWAEVFQLRLGYSETVVRPDLREITDASYVDARTGFLTDGDPSVRPADITNYDLRAEWYFNSGDNLSIGLYFKDIANPIEFFESAASDTNRSREIINAESGEVYGLELEGLKSLGFLGNFWQQFFIQANLTVQSSELVAGSFADAPTNETRDLAGASDYVANVVVGFDSNNAMHSATLSYNVFGERLFTAGRRGAPDTFEQPFHSLDLTYSWYPRDEIVLQFKARNLLDETVEMERGGVLTFEEKPGVSVAMSFEWLM